MRRRGEGHRDVLDTVDEVGPQALHLAVQADVGQPVEDAVEHHPDLHAGQVGPQAEVRPAAPEGHVVVGVRPMSKWSGSVEDGFVPVGRDVPEHDLVPLVDLLVADDHLGRGLCGGSA